MDGKDIVIKIPKRIKDINKRFIYIFKKMKKRGIDKCFVRINNMPCYYSYDYVLQHIYLKDDKTEYGGIAYEGETLYDFLEDNKCDSIKEINKDLKACGIKRL